VTNVIDAVVAGTEMFSGVARMRRGTARNIKLVRNNDDTEGLMH